MAEKGQKLEQIMKGLSMEKKTEKTTLILSPLQTEFLPMLVWRFQFSVIC